MTAPASPQILAMYQGEDFSQELSYFLDEAQTTPLVFTDPVMDIRAPRSLLASFDITGANGGLATITAPGVLLLTMGWQKTETITAGSYDLDIFAEVNGERRAITKRGVLQLEVTARVTQDEHP